MKVFEARVLIETVRKVAVALTDEEASDISKVLYRALERMEQEANRDR